MYRSYCYKSHDIVGYVDQEQSMILCPNCVDDPDKCDPIFAGSEWDRKIYCENCNEKIECISVIKY